jgi:hypothetical protein
MFLSSIMSYSFFCSFSCSLIKRTCCASSLAYLDFSAAILRSFSASLGCPSCSLFSFRANF